MRNFEKLSVSISVTQTSTALYLKRLCVTTAAPARCRHRQRLTYIGSQKFMYYFLKDYSRLFLLFSDRPQVF